MISAQSIDSICELCNCLFVTMLLFVALAKCYTLPFEFFEESHILSLYFKLSLAHDSSLVENEEVLSPPKIVLPLDPVIVQEGEPARFRCRVVGFPTPKVDWYLNGQSIRPSKRYSHLNAERIFI